MSTKTNYPPERFALPSRLLHWTMAILVVAQLFIAAVMMASLVYRPLLLAIHKPLGITILALVLIRLVYRILHRAPPFMSSMGPVERQAAKYSELLMYALLLIQPVVGWAMLSAAGDPIVLFGQFQLPAIAPHSPLVFTILRQTHTILAYLLFAAFTAHMCAVLLHTLVLRDKLLHRMSLWPSRQDTAVAEEPTAEEEVAK
ncbi:cytochrome b [Arthrobacter rhombi]|uniref:cytochrome b n=1 Tax=Arthrobacter rhombi TaxID=71253 RepID=UPI003F90AB40